MDLKKITNRNRTVPTTEMKMTVEIPVSVDTIRVNAEQTIALATVSDKIVLIPEKGDNAVTALEMSPAEFGTLVKALVQKAQEMGVMDKAPKAPKSERRPYTRRNTTQPAETSTPAEAPAAVTTEATFKVEKIRPARPSPEELASLRDELAREATMDFANEQVYDAFAPDAL